MVDGLRGIRQPLRKIPRMSRQWPLASQNRAGNRDTWLARHLPYGLVSGPAMLRNENGMLNGYVYIDVAGRDIGGYVAEAKRVVAERVKLPAAYTLVWSGQYEAMQRVRERLTSCCR